MDYLFFIKRFIQLPKVIQDLIGEYNVNHRTQMKYICNELEEKKHIFRYDWLLCDWCEREFKNMYRHVPWCYFKEYNYCHQWCEIEEKASRGDIDAIEFLEKIKVKAEEAEEETEEAEEEAEEEAKAEAEEEEEQEEEAEEEV